MMFSSAGTFASAHEFWVAPLLGQIAVGADVTADLKVGRMLRGERYPYLSKRFQSFTMAVGGMTTDVLGNEGDIPALSQAASTQGLHVIAHQTIPFRVTYDDWDVFRRYLSDEGLDSFADLHRARGLPEVDFSERYTRYAKALVQVGPAAPADRDDRVGLPLELVAGSNPYAATRDVLPVTLFWGDKPLANRQINVFHDNGAVTRRTAMTDEAGQALIPLSGAGEYLLNAVHLRAIDDGSVVWASHWATLSFKLQRDQ